MKIYITRHGETQWNLEGRLQGQLNSDLTPFGKEQAQWLGQRLSTTHLDLICCSSSGRAKETADLIKGNREIPLEYYDDMRELYLGDWEGLQHEDIQVQYPELYQYLWYEPEKFKPEDKESIEAIVTRAGRVFENLIEKHAGKDLLLVSHAMWIKGLLTYIKTWPTEKFWDGNFMKSTCLTVIELKNGIRSIVLEGDISHYK